MTIQDLVPLRYQTKKIFEIFHILSCFWSILTLLHNLVANIQNVPVLKRFLTCLTFKKLRPFLCLDHVYEFITL